MNKKNEIGANFAPQMSDYITQQKIDFYCSHVLPAVYDDALSPMEMVCILTDKINEIIKELNDSIDSGDKILIQEMVKNYVDKLFKEGKINLFRHMLNMVELGCDNTGVEDCSDIINETIQNNPRHTLFFPDGTYRINKTILIPGLDEKNISIFCTPHAEFLAGEILHMFHIGYDITDTKRPGKTQDFVNIFGGHYRMNNGLPEGACFYVNGVYASLMLKNVNISGCYYGVYYDNADGQRRPGNFYLLDSNIRCRDWFTDDTACIKNNGSTDNRYCNLTLANSCYGVYSNADSGSEFTDIHATLSGYAAKFPDNALTAVNIDRYNRTECFHIEGGAMFTNCYADSYSVGWALAKSDTQISNCRMYWFYKTIPEARCIMFKQLLDELPSLNVSNCFFSTPKPCKPYVYYYDDAQIPPKDTGRINISGLTVFRKYLFSKRDWGMYYPYADNGCEIYNETKKMQANKWYWVGRIYAHTTVNAKYSLQIHNRYITFEVQHSGTITDLVMDEDAGLSGWKITTEKVDGTTGFYDVYVFTPEEYERYSVMMGIGTGSMLLSVKGEDNLEEQYPALPAGYFSENIVYLESTKIRSYEYVYNVDSIEANDGTTRTITLETAINNIGQTGKDYVVNVLCKNTNVDVKFTSKGFDNFTVYVKNNSSSAIQNLELKFTIMGRFKK